jgi:hypothetical protein
MRVKYNMPYKVLLLLPLPRMNDVATLKADWLPHHTDAVEKYIRRVVSGVSIRHIKSSRSA